MLMPNVFRFVISILKLITCGRYGEIKEEKAERSSTAQTKNTIVTVANSVEKKNEPENNDNQ